MCIEVNVGFLTIETTRYSGLADDHLPGVGNNFIVWNKGRDDICNCVSHITTIILQSNRVSVQATERIDFNMCVK